MWSSSPSVRTIPWIGEERRPRGHNSGHRASWVVTSGVALTRYHVAPSGEKASEDWVSGGRRPARARWQLRQAQFHWGTPPPAAMPRRRTFTEESERPAVLPCPVPAPLWTRRHLFRVHISRNFRAERDLLRLWLHPHSLPTSPGMPRGARLVFLLCRIPGLLSGGGLVLSLAPGDGSLRREEGRHTPAAGGRGGGGRAGRGEGGRGLSSCSSSGAPPPVGPLGRPTRAPLSAMSSAATWRSSMRNATGSRDASE